MLWCMHKLQCVNIAVTKMHTCRHQCERHRSDLLLTSWPSSPSSALLWACGLHWPPHELWTHEQNTLKKALFLNGIYICTLSFSLLLHDMRKEWGKKKKTGLLYYSLLSLGHLCSDVGLYFGGVLNRLRPQNPHQVRDAYCKQWKKAIVAIIPPFFLVVFDKSGLSMATFGLWWRHQSQTDFLLNLFLSFPPCLSSQFLLFFLGQVNTQRHRLFCVNWIG